MAALLATARRGSQVNSLSEEALRELEVCNACRYCEGYCPVFPALARRNPVRLEDVSAIASICHDCRACYQACMYTPPHEFAINLPRVLSEVRASEWAADVWPARLAILVERPWAAAIGGVGVSAAVLLGAVAASGRWWSLLHAGVPGGGVYSVLPWPVMVSFGLLGGIFALVGLMLASAHFWKRVFGGPWRMPRWGPLLASSVRAVGLTGMTGGGDGCYYPDHVRPRRWRRRIHTVLLAGVGLTFVATLSAAVAQDVLGDPPPYPIDSVPVSAGVAGGVGIVASVVILGVMKWRSSDHLAALVMKKLDYVFMLLLALSALTGFGVLLARGSPTLGLWLVVHLSVVGGLFGTAPYGKMLHSGARLVAVASDSTRVGEEPGGAQR